MLNHSAAGIARFLMLKKKLSRSSWNVCWQPSLQPKPSFPSFLRFVIDQTLLGRPELLKERTLGIEIFGRDADYDTASDPIVRVTATEIRKRIAQYYQEPGHETELRLSLPSGSYVPQSTGPRLLSRTSLLKWRRSLPLPHLFRRGPGRRPSQRSRCDCGSGDRLP